MPVAKSAVSATSRCHVRQGSPPALARVEHAVRRDKRQRRRIEHVRRPSTKNVLADNGDGGRAGSDVPRFERAQDHRDEQPRQDGATGKLPGVVFFPEDEHVDQGGGGDRARQARRNQPDAPAERSQDEQNGQEDDEEAFRRPEESSNGRKPLRLAHHPAWGQCTGPESRTAPASATPSARRLPGAPAVEYRRWGLERMPPSRGHPPPSLSGR